MITNNGKALMYVSDWHEDNSNDPTYILQRTNGTEAQIKRNTTAYDKKLSYSSLANNIKIIVGTGTTPPTSVDYSLSNEITSPSLKVIASNSRNRNNCNSDYNVGIIMEASATLMNVSTTDTITINEIGLVTQDDTGASYLLMREVLNTPISLAPNETTALTLGVNKGTSSSGLTGNGIALCYINNFGNGKNNNGGTNYPLSLLQLEQPSYADSFIMRSYVNPGPGNGHGSQHNTNYKNFIDSITIRPNLTKGDSTHIKVISESCKNKNVDISKYSEPVILQATKTIVNNAPSHWDPVQYSSIDLVANDYKWDDVTQWANGGYSVCLAHIVLEHTLYLRPGESVSLTIVIG